MSIVVSCESGGDRFPAWLLAEPNTGATGKASSRPDPHASTGRRPRAAPSSPGKAVSVSDFPNLQQRHRTGRPDRIPGDLAATYAARRLSRRLRSPLIENEYSLQVIDVTKSAHHQRLFLPAARRWPDAVKKRLIDEIHAPYRARIRQQLARRLTRGATVIHLSVRTFAAQGPDKKRRADVGLLYDPRRREELDLCLEWIDEMYDELPMLRVRRNYPRRGTADSITKAMRTEFTDQRYLGIELLLNRAWSKRPVAVRDEVLDGIAECFAEVTQISHTEAA